MLRQPSFTFNSELCTGCKACMIACKDKHNLPRDVKWRRVLEFSGGEWLQLSNGVYDQNVFAYYVSISCNHCENAPCVKGCPTGAMHKDSDGIVSVNPDVCVGCRYCEWNCPYGAPQFNAEIKRMTKCDFCREYLQQDKEPACVAACPCRALGIGNYNHLKEETGFTHEIAPLPKASITQPRLFCIPNRHAKPQGSDEGIRGTLVSNPEEV